MKTVVVNMFAGPGAGKTTAAWEIASELKKRGYVTEYVPEYAKELVWDHRMELLDGSREHQLQLLQEQEHRVQRLDGQVDFIVTDSPILLNTMYLSEGNEQEKQRYSDAVYGRFSRYQNFCVFIQRSGSFEKAGRIHDLVQSRTLDRAIREMLDHYGIFYGLYQHETVHKIADNCVTTFQRVNRPERSQSGVREPVQETPPETLGEMVSEPVQEAPRRISMDEAREYMDEVVEL